MEVCKAEGMKLEGMFHQLLGLGAEWEVKSLELREEDGVVEIRIAETSGLWSEQRCPDDASVLSCYDHKDERRWRHLNIFQYRCEIVCKLPRGRCRKCGKVVAIKAPWEGRSKHFTLAFESMVLLLARDMPVKRVAAFVGEHDTRLWRMLHLHVEAAREHKDMSEVTSICCDELAIRKGHVYASVFADGKAREVLFATPSKEDITWKRFVADLREHGGDPAKIEWASIDMSRSYQSGAKMYLPSATTVFDKFHVIKMANDAVDTVRRAEMTLLPDDAKHMKKTRFVWLKNPKNLTAKQQEALEDLNQWNLSTAKAYQMRLVLQDIYQSVGHIRAHRRLKNWCSWTQRQSRKDPLLKPMAKVGKSIMNHLDGILAYWKSGYTTNAFMEGLMSVFSAVKRKARGFRTFKNIQAMLYFTASNLHLPFQPLFHSK